MSQINLHTYIKEIKQLFATGHFAQVVAHSRQILKTYPRYLEAYKLMGYALAEQKTYQEAENVLYRVLSIDISDFEAHKYLAEGFASTGQLEKAIWHVEHAFEIDPNHLEITNLREQYYRRATIPAPVVNGMSLASVARLYVKGGIYDQAIEELNRMIAHNPDRLDWKTLLAIAYWREGKNTEALKLGEAILEKLPNNYYARMVMGDIFWQNERTDIANGHLDILQQILLIDPSNREDFPLAAPILEQSENLSDGFSVVKLESSNIEDWASPTWESSEGADLGEQNRSTDEAQIENNEIVGEAGFEEVLSSIDLPDDEAPTKKMAPVTPEIDYDEDALGTGSLESFATEIEEGVSLAEVNDDLSTEDSFSWDVGTEPVESIRVADDPDPLSDSELSRLPDIENLMTAELDYGVDADDPTVESISDELNALSVNSIEELAELDRQNRAEMAEKDHVLSEDDFGLGDDDFGLEDDFFIDLTLDEVLDEGSESAEASVSEGLNANEDASETKTDEVSESFDWGSDVAEAEPENQISELIIEIDDDLAQVLDQPAIEPEPILEPPVSEIEKLAGEVQSEATAVAQEIEPVIEEDALILKADAALTQDEFSDVDDVDVEEDALDWLDSGDDFDDVFADLEKDMAEPAHTIVPDVDTATEINPAENDSISFEEPIEASLGLVENTPNEETTFIEETSGIQAESGFTDWLEAVDVPDEEPADMLDADEVTAGSDDAMSSGLFDFLSDDENQLNPLPNNSNELEEPLGGLDEPDWEIDFSEFDESAEVNNLFDDSSAPASDSIVEGSPESATAKPEEDDPFDTSWLDLEQTEEIDMLSEIEKTEEVEEVDLRTYAESLESDFDLLTPDDSEPDLDFLEEPDPVYASIERHMRDDISLATPADESKDPEPDQQPSEDTKVPSLTPIDEDLDIISEDEPFIEGSEEKVEEIKAGSAEANDPADSVAVADLKEEPVQTSSLEWLIPSEEPEDLPEVNTPDEDLGWLSLLDDATVDSNPDNANAEVIPSVPWTGDLSAAASSILMPDSQNGAENLSKDEAPDWLIEFPEYNSAGSQTDKLQEDELPDGESHFTKKIKLEEDPLPDAALVEEKTEAEEFEDDQVFDPVVFQESSSMKLPEWLSDTTESASLGYEPEPGLKADLTDTTDEDEIKLEAELIDSPEEIASAEDSKLVDGNLIHEDELDMEFDKNGNPIPPESQDLEDTLNWLEELATIDLEDDISKSGVNIKNLADDKAESMLAEEESLNDDPLSDIFSGGSALHAFADLESEKAEEAADVAEKADVSKETLSWLDNLFAPARMPKPEAPVEVEEAADALEAESESITEDAEESLLDLEIEADDVTQAADSVDSIIEEPVDVLQDQVDELFDGVDANELNELEEEINLSVESDMPTADANIDLDADLDIPDPPVVEQIVEASGSILNSDFDDLYISDDEISNAVEHGDEVPGMEDIPDDPESLMAWLNLEPESEINVNEAVIETVDTTSAENDLELDRLFDEAAEAVTVDDVVSGSSEIETPDLNLDVIEKPIPATDILDDIVADQAVEVESEPIQENAKPSMFGETDDITVSAEEISNAVEHGDEVPGMEDIPDDPDALMAWLDLAPMEDGDESVSVEDAIELIESGESSEADLIIADLGSDDSEPMLEAKSASGDLDLDNLGVDEELEDLFDDLAGPDGADIDDEDLIFGDLGTGRLSGTDWLDKMTFDSDPALLGDVPTVLPTGIPNPEDILETIDPESAPELGASSTEEATIRESSPIEPAGAQLEGIDELPDDPDEFMRILESNTAPAEVAQETNQVSADGETDIPEWLKVEADNSNDSLSWLDEASPSGVMNWLDAEEAIEEAKSSNGSLDGQTDGVIETSDLILPEAAEPVASIFDDPPENANLQEPAEKIDDFQKMLDNREDIPGLIRKLRNQLEVRNDPALQKLLGDAYMESGQLQDALDAYRQAQRLL